MAFKTRKNHRASKPGQMIHSDVGSFEGTSREGYNYFITFVDDCSKSVFVYPMKSKSDSFHCFKIFRAAFEKSKKHVILALTTDNGGEYVSNAFESHLLEVGIQHVPGPPHTYQLNGVAERANRTIGNLIRCSLISASLPKSFWVDALRHSFFTYNTYPCVTPQGFCSPNSVLGVDDVDLSYLHPFGCLVWYKIPEANRQKLDPKARASILLSYLPDGKGYRVWDLERRVVVKTRDTIFNDSRFPYGEPLKTPAEPIRVELPWPSRPPLASSSPTPSPPISTPLPASLPHSPSPPPRIPTPDLPLLNIQLAPRMDRRLEASVHNPGTSDGGSSPRLISPPPPLL